MAKSKDDIKYGTAQARHSEDEPVRVAYVAGTPLEAGKIADSDPVDLYSSSRNIPNPKQGEAASDQSQMHGQGGGGGGGASGGDDAARR